MSTGECQAPLTVGAGLATRTDGAARIPSPGRVWRRYAQSQLEQHVFLLRELRLATLGVRGPELRPAPAESSVSEVAVVFTDLAGFTAFNALHGDGVAVEHLQRVAAFVDNIVADHGGRVVMRLGDGQLLTFTNPDAAIVAALELVHTVPPPLSMRAGAHWGTPVLTRYDVLGHDVNVAARVVDAAPPGGILITKDLRDASSARPDVRFGRVVGRRMKGIKGRVPVCAVRRAA